MIQVENLRLKAVDSDLCVTNKGETHLLYKKCVDSDPEQIFSFKSNNFQDNNYFLMNISKNPEFVMSIFNGNEVNNNYLNLWSGWRSSLNPVVFRYELLKNGSYHIKSLSGKCIGSQNQTVKEDENLVINDSGGKNSELVVIPPVIPNFSGKNKIDLGTKYRFKIQHTELCMTNMKNDQHPDLGMKNCDKNNINQIFYIKNINSKGKTFYQIKSSNEPQFAITLSNGEETNNTRVHLWNDWDGRLEPTTFLLEVLKNGSYFFKTASGKCVGPQNDLPKSEGLIRVTDCKQTSQFGAVSETNKLEKEKSIKPKTLLGDNQETKKKEFCIKYCIPNDSKNLLKCYNRNFKPCFPCKYEEKKNYKNPKKAQELCTTACRVIKGEQTCDFYAYFNNEKKIINKEILDEFGINAMRKYLLKLK